MNTIIFLFMFAYYNLFIFIFCIGAYPPSSNGSIAIDPSLSWRIPSQNNLVSELLAYHMFKKWGSNCLDMVLVVETGDVTPSPHNDTPQQIGPENAQIQTKTRSHGCAC